MPLHDGRRGGHVAVRDAAAVDAAVERGHGLEQLLRRRRRHLWRRGRVQPHVLEDDVDVAVDLGLTEFGETEM